MLTEQGIIHQARRLGDPLYQEGPASWMSVHEDDVEVTDGDLVRTQAAFGYVSGAISYTLTAVLSSDREIVLNKIGFHSSKDGPLLSDSPIEPLALAPGQQTVLTITETLP